MTNISAHGDIDETAKAKKIIDLARLMEDEGVKCFAIMAAQARIGQ